jgi:uncharacterized protein YdcH (DUF465 family)
MNEIITEFQHKTMIDIHYSLANYQVWPAGGGRPMSQVTGEAALRDQLMKENEEYRRLAAEHQSCDDELEGLNNKHFLSEEEELKEKTLKKKKLMLKDQMYSLVQKARKQMDAGSR